MNTMDLYHYLAPGKIIHLIGIGGVSMSPLAEVLHRAGIIVQGSDMNESDTVHHLRNLGISVAVGHGAENLGRCQCVIRSAAIHDNNPEIIAARAAGIPVFERAQAWGAIMRKYKNAVCIAGTHGKTTTTSMTAQILIQAGADPTVMIGGTLPILNSGYCVGKGSTIVLESCEYCNSFLSFFPTIAVILNVEADHLDFFKDLEDIKHSFLRFAQLTPEDGQVVFNLDDPGATDVMQRYSGHQFTFSQHSSAADCRAENITFLRGLPSFDVVIHGQFYAHIQLQIGGEHNISNALAAACAAYLLQIDGKAVEEGLASFTGAQRRFQYKGEYHGAKIYDDYAHHPSELHALLTMAKSLGYQRIICAFQPHTYTRTKALFQDFIQVLQIPDIVVLAEIYAAREDNTIGISSADLAKHIPGSIYCATLDSVTDTLRQLAQPGDLILTVGAGDIYKAGEYIVK